MHKIVTFRQTIRKQPKQVRLAVRLETRLINTYIITAALFMLLYTNTYVPFMSAEMVVHTVTYTCTVSWVVRSSIMYQIIYKNMPLQSSVQQPVLLRPRFAELKINIAAVVRRHALGYSQRGPVSDPHRPRHCPRNYHIALTAQYKQMHLSYTCKVIHVQCQIKCVLFEFDLRASFTSRICTLWFALG